MSKSRKFAAFDIDGTLYRGNLTWDLFNGLAQRGIVPREIVDELQGLYTAHDKRLDDAAYHEYDRRVVAALYQGVESITDVDAYWQLGEELAERNAGRLYRYTRDLLTYLRDNDYYLMAITNGIGSIARPFAKALGFDAVIANDEVIDPVRKQVVDWAITTEVRVKANVLQDLIVRQGLTTEESVGVGDTFSDASMLELVEHPIPFNPEQRLYDVALSKGWPIVVERKNVVYELGKKGPYHRLLAPASLLKRAAPSEYASVSYSRA